MDCPNDCRGNPLYAPRSGNRRGYRNGNRGIDSITPGGLNHCSENASTAKETGDTKITHNGINYNSTDHTSYHHSTANEPSHPKTGPNTNTVKPTRHFYAYKHTGTRT
jgi:hypothetical protein